MPDWLRSELPFRPVATASFILTPITTYAIAAIVLSRRPLTQSVVVEAAWVTFPGTLLMAAIGFPVTIGIWLVGGIMVRRGLRGGPDAGGALVGLTIILLHWLACFGMSLGWATHDGPM